MIARSALAQGVKKVMACFKLVVGLFLFRVLLIAAAANDLTRKYSGIGFDDNAFGITVLQMRNSDSGCYKTRCALEKHQSDGHPIEFLRADRTGS